MGKWAGIDHGEFSERTRRILERYRRIAMVGVSADTTRPSYRALCHMKTEGYHVFPVNPKYSEVSGLPCYPSLLDIPEPVEIVDVFRHPRFVMSILEETLRIGAKVFWLQLGIVHEEAARRAEEAGLEVVMDRCVKMEHCRFWGRFSILGLSTGVIHSRRYDHLWVGSA